MTISKREFPEWPDGPYHVSARHDEVHVWRFSLLCAGTETDRLQSLLTADERDRAHRFRYERHRSAYIACRAGLRILLGRYLDRTTNPQARSSSPRLPNGETPELCPAPLSRHGYYSGTLHVNAFGKPFLPPEHSDQDLRFNVSHSGGVALIAIAQGREVGVDIEAIRSGADHLAISERFFSERERSALRTLSSTRQRDAFFACWTRKEAYIKARGKGLSIPLDQFDVSLEPDAPARLLASRDDPAQEARWSMVALDPGPGFAAALVVEGHDWRPRCWRLQEGASEL